MASTESILKAVREMKGCAQEEQREGDEYRSLCLLETDLETYGTPQSYESQVALMAITIVYSGRL